MIRKITRTTRNVIYDIIIEQINKDLEKNKHFLNVSKMRDVQGGEFYKAEYYSLYKNKICGYFAYIYDKTNRKIVNIEVIKFSNTYIFIKDFFDFCKYVYCFEHIELTISPQSPAYKLARKCFEKYNFRKVGILKKSVKLLDNKYYDLELWEKKRGG